MAVNPEEQPPTDQGRSNTPLIIGAVIAALVAAITAVIAVVLTIGDSHSRSESTTTSATRTSRPAVTRTTAAATPPAATGQLPSFTPSAELGANCQYLPAMAASKNVTPPRSGKVPTDPAQIGASVATDQGPIGLLLDNAKSPCTVNSFVSLAGQQFFDGTSCHRLTTSAGLRVLQCGDPTGKGTGGPGYEFANEYPTDQYPPGDPAAQEPVTYPRGTLAMANAGPDTNGSQFFLVYGDSQLPPQYTVFGTIDDAGLATLDKIAATGVEPGSPRGPEDGSPAVPVTITSVR